MTMNKIEAKRLAKNGFKKLDIALQEKYLNLIENLIKNSSAPISSIISWNEFKMIFSTIQATFTFEYEETMFSLSHYEEFSEFWIDGEESTTYLKKSTPRELLNQISVRGNNLQDIWKEVVFIA